MIYADRNLDPETGTIMKCGLNLLIGLQPPLFTHFIIVPVSGSRFLSAYIIVLLWEIHLLKRGGWSAINRFNPHFIIVPVSGSRFLSAYIIVLL
jgi:hypothetical protein